MATKYEWLKSIGNGDMNVNRVVALNRLPFFSTERAIAFTTKNFPEMTIEHNPIKLDPEKAGKIAAISQYEVQYLLKELDTVRDELDALRAKQDAKCKALEHKKHRSLMDDVELSVARDKRSEYANMASGVIQARMRLTDRLMELHILAGKQVSNWRI